MTNVDARLILRHQPPFRFLETVTLLADGKARAEIVAPRTAPLWAAAAERSALAVEFAAQTMGVLIRSQNGGGRTVGMLAGVHSFEWDYFSVPVQSVKVALTGSRGAFHDFKAVFYSDLAIVCGEMCGMIHLAAAGDKPAIAATPIVQHPVDQPLYDITDFRQSVDVIEMDITTRAACPVYAGHFPDAPITPGVLIVDMMIEAAQRGLAVPAGLRRIEDLIFSAPLLPGDSAMLRLKRTSDFEFSASLMRDGKRLARARLVLAPLPVLRQLPLSPQRPIKGSYPMNTIGFSADVAEKIRNVVIFEGLELDELGITLEEIGDDVLLFDAEGLDLDSVDALEVLAGVQREFGVNFPEIDQDFIVNNCSTVGQLARTVTQHLQQKSAA